MTIVEKHSKPLIAFAAIVYIVFAFKITDGAAYWNDAAWFSTWQGLVRSQGLLGAYITGNAMARHAHSMPVNYPPLYLYLLQYIPVPAIALGLISLIPCLWLIWKKFGPYKVFLLLAMPVSIYDVLFVGQMDYLFLFFLVMSLLYYDKRPVVSGVMAGLCLLLKEESIVFLPVFVVMAIKNKRFLLSAVITWSLFFLPLYSDIFTVLKASYLNNMSVFSKMSFTAGDIWALFTNTMIKTRNHTYDLIGYLFSAVWAVYVFIYSLRTRNFMVACYYMSLGFIFFPDQSSARDFIYPFFLAFFLYNMGQEKYKNLAYFFGIGMLLSIMALATRNPAIILVSVKILALVNLFILIGIIRDMVGKGSAHIDAGGSPCSTESE